MTHELTPHEWAELAHLTNVAAHHAPTLAPLREKVRALANGVQSGRVKIVFFELLDAANGEFVACVGNGGESDD